MERRTFGEEPGAKWESRKREARAKRRANLVTLPQILDEITEGAIIKLPLAALAGDLLAARRVVATGARNLDRSKSAPPPELLEFAHLTLDILEDAQEVVDCQREADNQYVYAQPGNRQWGRYLQACLQLCAATDDLDRDLAAARAACEPAFGWSSKIVSGWLQANKKSEDR